jgi:hypothetical protein
MKIITANLANGSMYLHMKQQYYYCAEWLFYQFSSTWLSTTDWEKA